MNKSTLLLYILGILLMIPLSANSLQKKVEGEFTYYGSAGESIVEMRRKALEGARADAIGREFGVLIAQDMMMRDKIVLKKETNLFTQSSQSTVRGEWIGDTEDPVYKDWLEDGVYVVHCKVKGIGKELSNKAPILEAEVLNVPDSRSVCRRFRDGDDIFVYVKSPESDIYAMVCLLGEDGYVQRFYPYMHTNPKESLFRRGREYILFDSNNPIEGFGETDSFHVVADSPDFNRLFVIYSPNYFSLGPWIHQNDTTPDYMTEKAFNDWLISQRRIDEEMSCRAFDIIIGPRD